MGNICYVPIKSTGIKGPPKETCHINCGTKTGLSMNISNVTKYKQKQTVHKVVDLSRVFQWIVKIFLKYSTVECKYLLFYKSFSLD